ncbi:hypothetical protein FGB62_213g06 [Gracilaria domingensis]|nr:hypothetical protein FGB62_213g06 [Gracilaria domingensis]
MSIDLFYSVHCLTNVLIFSAENRDRAKRVQELLDDVSGMQNAIRDKTNQLDEADARILPLLNDLMRKHGLRTVSELVDRVVGELPPELEKALRELLADLSKTSANLEKAFGAITSITLASAVGGVSAKAIQLVKSNAVFVSTRLTMKAFTVALRGGANALEEAGELFKAASKASSTLSTSFETTTSLGKALKFVKTAGKVLTVLGIVADVALTVIAAVEGAKQRDELQDQIKENFERRVSVALLTALASAAVAMNGNLESILLLESFKGKDPDAENGLQQAIDLLTEPIASSIEEVWDLISYEKVSETWSNLDQSRSSWTDEDPSLKEVIAMMEAEEDIAFT